MGLSERLNQSLAARVEAELNRSAEASADRPALGSSGGTVQRLGGNPITPRETQSTGAIPVGSPVQYNQGIVQGKPFQPQPGKAPQPLPPAMLANGDPNDLAGDGSLVLQPRFNVDFCVDADGVIYYWDNSASIWSEVGTAIERPRVLLSASGGLLGIVANDAALALINFGSFYEEIDTGDFFDPSNGTRFTFPQVGTYKVTFHCLPDRPTPSPDGEMDATWLWDFVVKNGDGSVYDDNKATFVQSLNNTSNLITGFNSFSQTLWVYTPSPLNGAYLEVSHAQQNSEGTAQGYGKYFYIEIEFSNSF